MNKFSIALLLVGSAYMHAAQQTPDLDACGLIPNIEPSCCTIPSYAYLTDEQLLKYVAMEAALRDEQEKVILELRSLNTATHGHLLKNLELGRLRLRLIQIDQEYAAVRDSKKWYMIETYGSKFVKDVMNGQLDD